MPVPALISSEQFDLIARRLATNQRAARRSTTHPYLLRGLVSCGVCRLSCSGITRTATDTRYRYYRCRGKMARVSSGRASCCPARFIPATQLDELVWADLCAVLRQPWLVAQALERAHRGAWVPEELRRRQATLRGVRASVARQRQRLLEAYLAEVIDLACFQRQDRGLAGQEADLLAREREVAAQGERLVEVSAIAQSMTAVLEQLRVGLDQAGFERRRQLVELLIDRVVVTNGQVEIRYVIPTTPSSTQTQFCHLRTDHFHLVALPIAVPVKGRRPPASSALAGPVGLLVVSLGDRVADTAGAQGLPVGAAAVGLVAGQVPNARAGPSTRADHPYLVHQPDQLQRVGVLARVRRVARLRPRPSQMVWSLVVSPPRERPSACWRLAWIGAFPFSWRRRRAGGPGPRWSRSGRPSPAGRLHPPGRARLPRPWPRSRRSASARTACRPSARARSARAGPAMGFRCAHETGCR